MRTATMRRPLQYYEHSLEMKERLGDSLGIADCHINLGEVISGDKVNPSEPLPIWNEA